MDSLVISVTQQKLAGTLERNKRIYALQLIGLSYQEIATRYGISRQRVCQIVSAFRRVRQLEPCPIAKEKGNRVVV